MSQVSRDFKKQELSIFTLSKFIVDNIFNSLFFVLHRPECIAHCGRKQGYLRNIKRSSLV